MDILQETILRYIPSGSRHTSKCIEMNCPCCVSMGESRPDSRQRGGLFLSPFSIGYNCFNCGFKFRQDSNKPLSKNAKLFLEEIGTSRNEIRKIMFIYRKNIDEEQKLVTRLFDKPKVVKPDFNFVPCELPRGTMLLRDAINDIDSEDHPAFSVFEYAHERGISDNTTLLWSSSTENKLNEYLIIPFIYEGMIVGYQARYTGNDPQILKYKRFINNNPNTGKYLYGIEHIFSDKKYIIINESLIDSYLYQGIGLMSHNISKNQIDIINSFKGEKILVPDFGKGGLDLIDVAIDNGWMVYFPFWDDGRDLGEATEQYGRIFLLNHILTTSVKSTSSIRLRKKQLIRG